MLELVLVDSERLGVLHAVAAERASRVLQGQENPPVVLDGREHGARFVVGKGALLVGGVVGVGEVKGPSVPEVA